MTQTKTYKCLYCNKLFKCKNEDICNYNLHSKNGKHYLVGVVIKQKDKQIAELKKQIKNKEEKWQ